MSPFSSCLLSAVSCRPLHLVLLLSSHFPLVALFAAAFQVCSFADFSSARQAANGDGGSRPPKRPRTQQQQQPAQEADAARSFRCAIM